MLFIIIRSIYLIVCAGVVGMFVNAPERPPLISDYPGTSFIVLMLITQVATLADVGLRRFSVQVISAVYFGLLVGWLLSNLLNQALEPVVAESPYRTLTHILTSIIAPYLCVTWLLHTKDDFRFIIPYVEFSKKVKGGRPYVLDTSAIIDGRIADMVETNVLDSELIVPTFVLKELQNIADSKEKLRRNRGRRGLDILARLQADEKTDVRMHEIENGEESKGLSIDQRLVEVAMQLGGRVVTNDFNLNKVASVQGVDVVNLNDVANSLKPRYLPGERMQIKDIKEGESLGQGVGYLDDGTMVVCEAAGDLVGTDADIIVTSVLQNSAGRMIFGKLWDENEH
jgi:uncharacterized protein YacL